MIQIVFQIVALCLILLIIVLLPRDHDEPHTHVEPTMFATFPVGRDVTVALTGVSSTGSIGRVSPFTTVTLTGVSV